MPDWTDNQLDAIGHAYELEISSRRRDRSLSPRVTIWAVRLADEVFVRSVNGPDARWYRNLQIRPTGRVWSGGVEQDVRFQPVDHDLDDQIDEAYRAKFGASSCATQRITAPLARQTTLRLDPTSD